MSSGVGGVRVGVVFQALAAPEVAGTRKPEKPGGYADSGADIAWNLRTRGVSVATPVAGAAPEQDLDWVFPDTRAGVDAAVGAGATVLWANTVLFEGHPIAVCDTVLSGAVRVVGQRPAAVQRYDDKWAANAMLRMAGLPVPNACLVVADDGEATSPAGADHGPVVSRRDLRRSPADMGRLRPPLVVKPVRGRGSAGVSVVESSDAARGAVDRLLESGAYGAAAIVEEYLPGTEVTVAVMPPGRYPGRGRLPGGPPPERGDEEQAWWALPPVRRFAHRDGVAPYSGTVAVVRNSAVVPDHGSDADLSTVVAACRRVPALLGATAPVRIDCRQGTDGSYRIFDVNLKPNLTGPGRPGREEQLGLLGLAAQGVGWSYSDLLLAVLCNGGWTGPGVDPASPEFGD